MQTEAMSDISSLDSSQFDDKGQATMLGFQERLWRILFGNFNRAVEELYYVCEDEFNADRCDDVINILDNARKDFVALRTHILQQSDINYHLGGVSWEVRKPTRRKQVSHDCLLIFRIK